MNIIFSKGNRRLYEIEGNFKMNLEYLKKQRLKKDMTILEVSKRLGYSTTNGYWKLETGSIRLTLEASILNLLKY